MTYRLSSKRQQSGSPEALAARLPADLRSLGGVSDYRSFAASVVDWLDSQAPGRGQELSLPVMQLAGLTPADHFRAKFAQTLPSEQRLYVPTPDQHPEPPYIPEYPEYPEYSPQELERQDQKRKENRAWIRARDNYRIAYN